MPVELWEIAHSGRRGRRWAFRVTCGGAVAFDSAWVPLRYASREDAAWLAGILHRLAESAAAGDGRPVFQRGPSGMHWSRDLGDDCSAEILDYSAHAEWVSGPRRGGAWYCALSGDGGRIFHTGDRGIEPASGEAARWLCELMARAASSGRLEAYSA